MKKLILILLILNLGSTLGFAQQSRVDSVVTMINKCKTAKGLDTAAFRSVLGFIGSIKLTDTAINQIESAAKKLNKDTDEDLSYTIQILIFYNLNKTNTDFDKAIEYGKHMYENLEKSKTPNADILKSVCYRDLRLPYRNSTRLAEGFQYFSEKLNEFKIKNDSLGLVDTYYVLSGFFRKIGLIDQAIYNMRKSLSYMDTIPTNDRNYFRFTKGNGLILGLNNMAILSGQYLEKGEFNNSLIYSNRVIRKLKEINFDPLGNQPYSAGMVAHANKAYALLLSNQLDSVGYFLDLTIKEAKAANWYDHVARALQIHALHQKKIGAIDKAEAYLEQCWQVTKQYQFTANSQAGNITPDYYLALIKIDQKKYNDAIALLSKDIVWAKNIRSLVLRDHKLLAEVYEKIGNTEKAKQHYKEFIALQDSVLADENKYRTSSFELEVQMNEKEKSISKLQSENKINSLTRNFSVIIAALLSLLALGLYFRFKSKQKANQVLENTLSKLKATQAQLIQKEKLASLGELTAGIAHEIQNPLNFVNNFSEMSVELAQELKDEVKKTEKDWELIEDLAEDLSQNQQKINLHGKRASSIVSGMLEHSKASTGERALTDINKLADEYLRLSYHGIRAKDSNFNSDYKIDFDENLPKIKVIPQDMGRVLLNLINNAFWAVKTVEKPLVTVKTEHTNNQIILKVIDNGTGMPESVKAKIFQPFFTTKPTGEGTGLGLSLAYDIVTKGHGGTLEVESTEGVGSEFIISLPFKTNE